MRSKFVKGDKITYRGENYTVTDVSGMFSPYYSLEDKYGYTIIRDCSEIDPHATLSNGSFSNSYNNSCECGAYKVYGSKIADWWHYTWCKLFREPRE